MKSTSEIIPKQLIYEVYKGRPIHYRGYRDVMLGQKQAEQIMGSSYIQSLIISNLFFLLKSKLSADFVTLTSEVGLNIGKQSRRAADIAIFEKSQLKNIEAPHKYLNVPPKYVVEVDIKASNDDIEDATSYYHKKTDELLDFGVAMVIWIFTASQKVMIAQKGSEDWTITSWDISFSSIENIPIRLQDIVKE